MGLESDRQGNTLQLCTVCRATLLPVLQLHRTDEDLIQELSSQIADAYLAVSPLPTFSPWKNGGLRELSWSCSSLLRCYFPYCQSDSQLYIYINLCVHIHICMYKISLIFFLLSWHQAGKQRLSLKVILEMNKFSKTFRVPKTNTGKHPNMVVAFILQTLLGVECLVYERAC